MPCGHMLFPGSVQLCAEYINCKVLIAVLKQGQLCEPCRSQLRGACLDGQHHVAGQPNVLQLLLAVIQRVHAHRLGSIPRQDVLRHLHQGAPLILSLQAMHIQHISLEVHSDMHRGVFRWSAVPLTSPQSQTLSISLHAELQSAFEQTCTAARGILVLSWSTRQPYPAGREPSHSERPCMP